MISEKSKKNLKPKTTLSKEEAKALGSKGGKRSVEVRRERKTLRETMELALQCIYKDGLTAMQLGVDSTIKKWIETGDIALLNGIRDLIGEKPVEKVSADINNKNAELLKEYMENVKDGKLEKGKTGED